MEDKIFQEFSHSQKYVKDQISSLVDGKRIIDLLLFAPFDYRSISLIENSTKKPEGEDVAVEVLILSHEPSFKISAKSPYKINAEFNDGTSLIISFFAGNAGMWKSMFKENTRLKISCKLKKFGNLYYTNHPKIIQSSLILKQSGSMIEPRYNLTGNLTQYNIKNIIKKHLSYINDFDFELNVANFMSFKEAVFTIHEPKNLQAVEKARERLAFEEIFAKNIAFLIANLNTQNQASPSIKLDKNALDETLNALPFCLTSAQQSALSQILDLQKQKTQNTVLLQGDVGSGKTIIAILSAINIVLSGFQVAVMSPTFILANQTFLAFEEIASKMDIPILFFSGEDRGRKRKDKLELIKQNKVKIVIGTHALFSSDVEFCNLGYAIIDEQHRFGINQRLALSTKSLGIKTLLMTATPIPRTLSMALFGEIEVAYIKEKPQNRKEIITKLFSSQKIPEIIEAIKRKIQNNELVYWVVPFIEESDESAERNGTSIEYRAKVLKECFKEEEVGIIHGKMKESEIFNVMESFKAGSIKIILATTVIEVGVNVANATLMVIESAENFGLASLHQLRGRVGRGDLQSYCFLVTTTSGENSKRKLEILTKSTDGFLIAEKDMEIRGSGAILSKMQSGFEGFKFVKMEKDLKIITLAKKQAKALFKIDSNLQTELGLNVRKLLKFYNYDYLINYYKI